MNCITSWSARYQTAIIDRLEREHHPVSATARAHISAVRYAHVNQHGRYRFHKADGDKCKPLDSARLLSEVPDQALRMQRLPIRRPEPWFRRASPVGPVLGFVSPAAR
jgi:hypothetical protein